MQFLIIDFIIYRQEMTPYEVGDAQWKSSVQYLQTVPILAMLIRGM